VVSYKSATTGTTSQSSTEQIFDYTYSAASVPATTENLNAARVTGYIAGMTTYSNKCEENEDENKMRSLHRLNRDWQRLGRLRPIVRLGNSLWQMRL
jgi:hypothetical protein